MSWTIEGDCIFGDDGKSFIRLNDVSSVTNRIGYHTQLHEMILTVLGGEKEFVFEGRSVADRKFNIELANKIIELNKKKKPGRPTSLKEVLKATVVKTKEKKCKK